MEGYIFSIKHESTEKPQIYTNKWKFEVNKKAIICIENRLYIKKKIKIVRILLRNFYFTYNEITHIEQYSDKQLLNN